MISTRSIGRLSLYRRILSALLGSGSGYVYSHQLAEMSGCTAAQVRRDLMGVGYSGSPARGYAVADLIESIDNFLDSPEGSRAVLVGVGNLGRAILCYFQGRRPKLNIVAAFDKNPQRTGRVICGVRSHPVEELETVAEKEGATLAIITVPADEAQRTAERLIEAGVRGIVNFAPVRIQAPPRIHVEDIDITMSLEKAAFFARQPDAETETAQKESAT